MINNINPKSAVERSAILILSHELPFSTVIAGLLGVGTCAEVHPHVLFEHVAVSGKA
mgnify:CR=1 FL=1